MINLQTLAAKPTYRTLLPSGYWHVRFGPQQFVQWPMWRTPEPDDVFWGSLDERLALSASAERAIEGPTMIHEQISSVNGAHPWFRPVGYGYDICYVCGAMKRRDKQNKPCKGPTRLRPMEPEMPKPKAKS